MTSRVCAATGKVVHATENHAARVAQRVNRARCVRAARQHREFEPLFPYRCEACGAWHTGRRLGEHWATMRAPPDIPLDLTIRIKHQETMTP